MTLFSYINLTNMLKRLSKFAELWSDIIGYTDT